MAPHPILARDPAPTPALPLFARADAPVYSPGGGSQPATNFNGPGFIALFAILGALMVIASMWFFFWAKNGGFQFREGDWEDYKSTVLRRKGPDGKTLSNATKSTKLGGSSIAGTQHYKWAKQAARSVVGRDEKGRKGVRGKRGWAKTHSITYDDDLEYMNQTVGTQTVSDMTEIREEPEHHDHDHSRRYRDRDVREYKREKPARVGGLNRAPDGSDFYGTNSDISQAAPSDTASDHPMIPKSHDAKERAERRAREEAARMERRWKRDAEEAAAALARENTRFEAPRRSVAPAPSTARPSVPKHHHRNESPPKRRDFSYTSGPASEILSTSSYTASSARRTSNSYYDEYRPHGPVEPARTSPRKAGGGRRGGQGGYRRGADDDLD